MPSVVGICNSALRKIGATTITSLEQGTKNANYCNDRYAELRDSLLEMSQWNFAVKRKKLAQLDETPVVKFDYAYSLPPDYIRAISVHDSNEGIGIVDHKIENGKVLSSANEVWMTYVSLVTDPNLMSPLFREALAFLIAVEAATAIAQSRTMAEQLYRQFRDILRRARSSDSLADLPDRMPAGSWRTQRSGRLSDRRWSW